MREVSGKQIKPRLDAIEQELKTVKSFAKKPNLAEVYNRLEALEKVDIRKIVNIDYVNKLYRGDR